MRLWSIHPRHLDAAGLVALWREGLLARAVLRGKTRGYRHHPQLARFRKARRPIRAIESYLAVVYREARKRGYRFDRARMGNARASRRVLTITTGQLRFEWNHLRKKLRARDPARYRACRAADVPQPHPLFRVIAGPRAEWERAGK